MVDTYNTLEHNGKCITDHKLVYCDVQCVKPKCKAKLISYHNFGDFDCDRFIEIVSNLKWDDLMSLQDIYENTNTLTTNIVHVFYVCAPMRRKRITRRSITQRKNKCKNYYFH